MKARVPIHVWAPAFAVFSKATALAAKDVIAEYPELRIYDFSTNLLRWAVARAALPRLRSRVLVEYVKSKGNLDIDRIKQIVAEVLGEVSPDDVMKYLQRYNAEFASKLGAEGVRKFVSAARDYVDEAARQYVELRQLMAAM